MGFIEEIIIEFWKDYLERFMEVVLEYEFRDEVGVMILERDDGVWITVVVVGLV